MTDPILQGGQPTDIVIAIMGPTGAGKTSLINDILGENRLEVGHDLASRTAFLQPVVVDPSPNFPKLKGRRLVIVDTPGFDDTYVDDVKILQRIATWLGASYKQKMVLGGVVYLHDISQDRFTGTARKNLELFKHLCGQASLDKVVLATTKWGRLAVANAEGRESELKSVHWRTLIEKGSKVRRCMGGQESGWDILNVFLERAANRRRRQAPGLQIQRELIMKKKEISNTKAGMHLRYTGTLEEVPEKQWQVAGLDRSFGIDDEGRHGSRKENAQRDINELIGERDALTVQPTGRIRRFLRLL